MKWIELFGSSIFEQSFVDAERDSKMQRAPVSRASILWTNRLDQLYSSLPAEPATPRQTGVTANPFSRITFFHSLADRLHLENYLPRVAPPMGARELSPNHSIVPGFFAFVFAP